MNYFGTAFETNTYYNVITKEYTLVPPNVTLMRGSIVDVESWATGEDIQIITQQNNCVATKSHGLSENIYKAFPFADIYAERGRLSRSLQSKKLKTGSDSERPTKQRKINSGAFSSANAYTAMEEVSVKTNADTRGKTGTVIFKQKDRIVIANMLAQFYTGKSDRFGTTDTSKQREQWFNECLHQLTTYIEQLHEKKVSVAFPWLLGCGLAGGNWNNYLRMLMQFAENVPSTQVVLICFVKY
jgi:hypothetical protein